MSKRRPIRLSADLTQAIEETLAAGSIAAGNTHTESIPLRLVKLDPQNPRKLSIQSQDIENGLDKDDPLYKQKSAEYESLMELANEIKEDGLIHPITVYKENSDFILIAGERRTLASKIAGFTHITAIIREKPSNEYKLTRIQWSENAQRKNLSLSEKLNGLQRLVRTYIESVEPTAQITPSLISQLANCSLPHAMHYYAVMNADSEIAALIKAGNINNLEKAALILKAQNSFVKNELLQACLEGKSLKDMAAMSKTVKGEVAHTQLSPIKNGAHKTKKSGAKAKFCNLGKTDNKAVARIVLESVLMRPDVMSSIPTLSNLIKEADWEDYGSINNIFKTLIARLEKVNK